MSLQRIDRRTFLRASGVAIGLPFLEAMIPAGAAEAKKSLAQQPRMVLIGQGLGMYAPNFFPQAAGKVALQLSGHTHGGQINLGPIRPGEIVLPYGYVEGRYEKDGSQLYVNRGFGTAGPPARIGSPPEVTRIVLVAG